MDKVIKRVDKVIERGRRRDRWRFAGTEAEILPPESPTPQDTEFPQEPYVPLGATAAPSRPAIDEGEVGEVGEDGASTGPEFPHTPAAGHDPGDDEDATEA